MRAPGWLLALTLAAAGLARAGEVHTNALNRDPLVKEAFAHFYDLDYPGAVERFERFRQMHPGDPQASALLLDAMLFQELYRLVEVRQHVEAHDKSATMPYVEHFDLALFGGLPTRSGSTRLANGPRRRL